MTGRDLGPLQLPLSLQAQEWGKQQALAPAKLWVQG